jgi:two-component system, NtrC family, sensor histidine kinase HydH
MKGCLLLVEDNAELRENLIEVLRVAGHRVSSCNTVAAVSSHMPGDLDVAIVDLILPDGNGYAVTRTIKEIQPLSEVILLTGFPSAEETSRALHSGAWAWIAKPFSTPELLMRVEQAVEHVFAKREKEEALQRAKVAERLAAAGTVTAGLSHEIRNPLNAAALQLSVLHRRLRRQPLEAQTELMEPLQLALGEIKRVDRLLTDFLDLAKPPNLAMKRLDVSGLLARATALFSVGATEKRVNLTQSSEAGLEVVADAEKLHQVVTNLLLNALDAVKPGGRVRLTAVALHDSVRIDVDDDGEGVREDTARHIFEPFFTTKAKGTGLGLAISHHLMTLQGGKLQVAQSPLGGARFSVVLPKAPRQ